jgi:hypothetical protein
LNVYAQDRKVIASAGRDISNGLTGLSQYLMTYTIGEPLIYGGSTTTNQISNGFIQPIGITAVAPPSPSGLILQSGDIVVYPNPFGTFLMVNGPAENEEEIKVQLIDQQGKLILDEQVFPKHHKLEIPESCSPGVYFLNLYSLQGQFIQQSKLIKMNIDQNPNIR